MSRRPDDLIYTVDERPPTPTLLALGFQHAALLSIYLVMIVIIFRAAHAPHAAAISDVSLGTFALLSLPHVGAKRRICLEEEPFSYGLADFLTGV